jgi:N-acetylmuramoyl-L-alanine amidase
MMFKKVAASVLLIVFVICCSAFVINNPTYVQKQKLKRIVIDAGHGGSDFGASGRYSHEKDISLAVALALEKEINAQIPDVEVYMTRTTDVFDRVTEKANKANAAKGDLFISIHCNDAGPIRHTEFIGYKTETYYKGKGKNKKKYTRKVKQYRTYTTPNPAKGTETFIWGLNKTDAKEKALRDHEDLFLDSISAKELQDFDPNDPEKAIIYNIKTKQYFDRSARLALTVEEEFKKTGRPSRQAQQRGIGIWVLQAVAMPAILVETGFLSNQEEEDYLNSPSGQKEIAEVITNAVKRYKYTLETKGINPGSMNTEIVDSKK